MDSRNEDRVEKYPRSPESELGTASNFSAICKCTWNSFYTSGLCYRGSAAAANDSIIRSQIFRDIITTCKAKRARHRELFCGPFSELCAARLVLSPRFVAHLLYDSASALASSSPLLFAACKLWEMDDVLIAKWEQDLFFSSWCRATACVDETAACRRHQSRPFLWHRWRVDAFGIKMFLSRRPGHEGSAFATWPPVSHGKSWVCLPMLQTSVYLTSSNPEIEHGAQATL